MFTFFFWFSAPYYFLRLWRRGNWRAGFSQRFGRYDTKLKQAITNRHVFWLHAVSVGEVNLAIQLIRALEPRVPNLKIVVSTTTTTGMGELRRKLPSHIEKIYYPIDRRRCVQRAFSTLRPEAVAIVEAEIWPNFLWQAHSRRTPVFLVNARLSERSFRGYKRFPLLFRPLFASLAGVSVQHDQDRARLIDLGCRPDAIRVVGNLKYDTGHLEERCPLDVPTLFRQLSLPTDSLVLLGGSTHPGEEAILAQQFQRLKKQFPRLFLVLVPRHFERGKTVGRELSAQGVRFVYRSDVTAGRQYPADTVECLLVNTTGELRYFYEHATVIFVGKSLVGRGGQNPIEVGAVGKAMVFGPHMQNFASVAAAFVADDGAVQVRDAAELESTLASLLADQKRRESLGRNARKVVHENRGAIERTVDMIVQHLSKEEMYVAGNSSPA
ncbi:MAG: 3-deoxy-D-manno-octulosonic acid transferase [Candidatus Omnitrophica bacterium]|nr:3-deoxy-D-manno-octulosonic acid transferase [Candidatus Omnitrophota bacterium]